MMEWSVIVRLLIAAAAGALVGLEREVHGKDAGIRTFALVSLGACIFGIISGSVTGAPDPTRIAAAVVTGVGFLGAGVIIRGKNHVVGLTTATTLWVAAAVGVAIAYGYFALGFTATIIVLLILFIPHIRKQV